MSTTALKDTKEAKAPKAESKSTDMITPQWHESAREIQEFGTVIQNLPIGIDADVRSQIVDRLNIVLANTLTIRDLYKKSHWQVSGPTFYQLHLLFDKHYDEQIELADLIGERIQALGGVSIAMAADVADLNTLQRPPRGREEVPVQISRLLQAHEIILKDAHDLAEKADDLGDDGTNDLMVSNIIRTHERQVWFISEHLVEMPLVHAKQPGGSASSEVVHVK